MRSTHTVNTGILYAVTALLIFLSSSAFSQQRSLSTPQNLGKIQPFTSMNAYQASPGPVDGSSMSSGLRGLLSRIEAAALDAGYMLYQYYLNLNETQSDETTLRPTIVDVTAMLGKIVYETDPRLYDRLINVRPNEPNGYTDLLKFGREPQYQQKKFDADLNNIIDRLKPSLPLNAEAAKSQLAQELEETDTYLNSISISSQVRLGSGIPEYLRRAAITDFSDGFGLGVTLLNGEKTGFSTGVRGDIAPGRGDLIKKDKDLICIHNRLLQLIPQIRGVQTSNSQIASLAGTIMKELEDPYEAAKKYAQAYMCFALRPQSAILAGGDHIDGDGDFQNCGGSYSVLRPNHANRSSGILYLASAGGLLSELHHEASRVGARLSTFVAWQNEVPYVDIDHKSGLERFTLRRWSWQIGIQYNGMTLLDRRSDLDLVVRYRDRKSDFEYSVLDSIGLNDTGYVGFGFGWTFGL